MSIILYKIMTHYFLLGINASSSLPDHLFVIIKGCDVHVGDYSAFYPPPNPLYENHIIFIKKIAGEAGLLVTEKQRVFYVNGYRIGYAKSYSSKGLPLKKGPVGIIPKGYYFVYAPHEKSFDSRYGEMGWVSYKNIIGRAYPLF